MTKIAAVQMISAVSIDTNIATARRLITQAAEQGADLVLLPEYWPSLEAQDADKLVHAEEAGGGKIQDFMSGMAKELGIWLVGGTMSIRSNVPGKVLNTMMVYNPQGENVARYDKIHLFSFSKGDESYDESKSIAPGDKVVTFEAPFGRVGLSVCYDLRFPELYRAMGTCSVMVMPAAFVYTTGRVHWEILLRARAIENQCYLLASGQGGKHETGRRTWGHSMVVSPWGEILDVLPEGEGVVIAELDVQQMADIRERLPALKHRKL
ncbi:MAG: carbon-nitrogen hydrolase family protein [Burkholderiaceae bacterium]|nr:carbon-nitrogen hydrolase family protein [Burkholderiaceae bacterium]